MLFGIDLTKKDICRLQTCLILAITIFLLLCMSTIGYIILGIIFVSLPHNSINCLDSHLTLYLILSLIILSVFIIIVILDIIYNFSLKIKMITRLLFSILQFSLIIWGSLEIFYFSNLCQNLNKDLVWILSLTGWIIQLSLFGLLSISIGNNCIIYNKERIESLEVN